MKIISIYVLNEVDMNACVHTCLNACIHKLQICANLVRKSGEDQFCHGEG